jgi:hypothetical protein
MKKITGTRIPDQELAIAHPVSIERRAADSPPRVTPNGEATP